MRLFVAINLDKNTKEKIVDAQSRLKQLGRGSFTRRENLHLTLVFLGEVSEKRLGVLKKALNNVSVPRMELVFDSAGCFKRNGGDIWYIGLKENEALASLQKKLAEELRNAGFKFDERKFKPHLTIARRVRINKRPNDCELLEHEFTAATGNISLMLSERVEGKLKYSELHEVISEEI